MNFNPPWSAVTTTFQTAADPELPQSVRRMGKFLLKMLRVEYEKRQMPIAGLNVADANARLRDQVRKYVKGVYPFDRELRPGETAYQWWVSLDNDQSNDAQPLAVC
jgi:hypothetical protein